MNRRLAMFKRFNLKGAFSWPCFLARIVDYSLLYTLLAFGVSFLPFFLGTCASIVLGIAVPFLWIPIEAYCLSRYGRTPGYALFCLRVQKQKGGNLSFKQALKQASF